MSRALKYLGLCAGLFVSTTAAYASSNPVVHLPYGSFEGNNTPGGLDIFLGIPFAAPPIGARRFALPEPPLLFKGIRKAHSFGAACPQQVAPPPPELPIPFPPIINSVSEDCLFINVYKPSKIPKSTKLPVLFWIYGGGFEIGDTSSSNASDLIRRSIALDEPVIYVSANYRLNAFGFLGGREVKEAGIGNAGLQDQVAALQWVQKYITQFGGDPGRVTIWGESAGAISVGFHMIFNDGNPKGLFAGAIMESGSPNPLPKIESRQQWFDSLVDATKCSGSSDLLECLRRIPYEQLLAAINQTPNIFSYNSVNPVWTPMVDGRLISRDPWVSLKQGKYAKVPFITGVDEDEGTLFSYSSLNVTTNSQFLEYVKSNFLHNITDAQLQAVASAYPEDPAKGSPFHTGTSDAFTPEFKRISAFQGDMFIQAPRRHFLAIASNTQNAYAYRYARGITFPGLGAFHSSELGEFYGQEKGTNFIGADSVVFFAIYGNPNAPKNSISHLSNITWDKWSSSSKNPPLLTFIDPAPSVNITLDTFRQAPIQLLVDLLPTKIGNPF
ncbi:sterol esterase [Crepidotus variabilis]|uniref:Carboxylic ester hydrolase n=1 Tax=Crepidotus variabilis TaxID=179855 RepID=A0A9P6EJ16_9AGAR|nr:sterol esterase [Crepidotus variabilis]